MGRGRRVVPYCALRHIYAADEARRAELGIRPGESDYRRVVTWCGDKTLMSATDRAAPLKLATCPKCAAAIGKAKLAALKGRVALERMAEPPGYWRSGYVVSVDGVPRGLVGVANGWGERWRLHRLPKPDSWNGLGAVVAGDPPGRYDAQRWPTEGEHAHRYIAWPVHHAAKEAMACAALAFHEAGQLPTLEEQAALDAQHAAARAVEEQERQARAVERAKEREAAESVRLERLATWREALASLEARGDLTNLERAGLEAAKALGWN